MEYVNHCCWKGRLGKLRDMPLEAWLQAMEKNYASVSHVQTYTEGMVRAWVDTFEVLQSVSKDLPASFDDLYVFFEYALPLYPPKNGKINAGYVKRADVTILSGDCVAVLEFKQNDTPYLAAVRQARAYRRRIQEWHDASRGMRKRAFVVLTRASETTKKNHKVLSVSPDMLPAALLDAFGENPAPAQRVRDWQHSTYSVLYCILPSLNAFGRSHLH